MSTTTTYDLIVVGTGFASSFFLYKYLEQEKHKNSKVLVLERGTMYSHKDRLASIRGKKIDYEQNIVKREDTFINSNSKKPWIFDPNFGGSSNCWWGSTPRLMPNDFKLKTKYGVGFDWPISYDDLEKFYVEAEQLMQISGPEVTPYKKSSSYPLPSHKLSTFDRLMQKKHGEEVYFSIPSARASKAIDTRNACCSSVTCDVCPVDAKFTIENGFQNLYKDSRVEVKILSQVLRIILQNNIATGVEVLSNGKKVEYKSNFVALGTNSLFNAHILLNSGDTSPLLGKGLSEQVGVFAYAHLDHFSNVGGSSSITAHGYNLYDGTFRNKWGSCLLESHNLPIIRNERGRWRDIARFKFVFEDIPNLNNAVVLSADETKPLVKFEGHTEYAHKAYENLKSNLGIYFEGLPVEEVFLDDYFQETEFHNQCSVKMGVSLSDSVVDKHLLHHTYRNVAVLGGSAFASVAAANPTLTIAALSLYAAHKIFE